MFWPEEEEEAGRLVYTKNDLDTFTHRLVLVTTLRTCNKIGEVPAVHRVAEGLTILDVRLSVAHRAAGEITGG